ncbi:MAG: AbrB/MazE/SpoVT family DNA-binding domain-containing protein, partial [Candidatus Thermoplasmatota archaeon]|nr:AbrB/MazE/SpoVT family DNA-binding domain-containing protein [Candidatus Thermoplasmatota archaeon]
MEVAITKISSKGQIVIPSNMRKDIVVGEEFLIIKEGDKLIMKKISELTKQLKEELLFAKRVEKAWKTY